MGLTRDLLEALCDYPSHYRRVWHKAYGYPGSSSRKETRPSPKWSEGSKWATLSRLKARGLVEREGNEWRITNAGREYAQRIRARIGLPAHSKASRSRNAPKNMVVIFDIPEKEKRKRDWLRIELRSLGFSMLQESVWFGPSPLPQSFVENVTTIRLLPYLKFFEAKERDVV